MVLFNVLLLSAVVSCSYFDLSQLDKCEEVTPPSHNNILKRQIPFELSKAGPSQPERFWPIGIKRTKVSPANLELIEEIVPEVSAAAVGLTFSSIPDFSINVAQTIFKEFAIAKAIKKEIEMEKKAKEQKVAYELPRLDPNDPNTYGVTCLTMPTSNFTSSPIIMFSKFTTHAEIIEQEISSCGFKSARRQMYRTILEIISRDDVTAYIAVKEKFESLFKASLCGRQAFVKGGFNGYLIRYMILFGSSKLIDHETNFSDSSSARNYFINFDVIKYLIETKSLDVVVKVLKNINLFNYPQNFSRCVFEMIKLKFNNLSPFRYKLLEYYFNNIGSNFFLSRVLLSCGSDQEIIEIILSDNLFNSSEYSHNLVVFFANIIFENAGLFMRCNLKNIYRFAICLIRLDDVEKLRNLVDLLGDAYFIRKILNEQNSTLEGTDEMQFSAKVSAKKCFQYFYETTFKAEPDAFKANVLRYIIIYRPIYLDIFIADGLNLGTAVEFLNTEKQPIIFKLAQFAFFSNNTDTLSILMANFGAEAVVNSIREMWPTSVDQLRICVRKACKIEDMINFCEQHFGLNIFDKFQLKGKNVDALNIVRAIAVRREILAFSAYFCRRRADRNNSTATPPS